MKSISLIRNYFAGLENNYCAYKVEMTKIASLMLIHCIQHTMSREGRPLMNGTASTPTRSASVTAEYSSFCGSSGAKRTQGQSQTTRIYMEVPPGSCVWAHWLELRAGLPREDLRHKWVRDLWSLSDCGLGIALGNYQSHAEAWDTQARREHHPKHDSPIL